MLAQGADYSANELRQGDVLSRNEILRDAIGKAHQYYATTPDYDYFLVLTPSCDLVLRGNECKSRYISLAAIRPLDILLERELKKYKRSLKVPGLFCNLDRKDRASQFVERLLHNTEEGFLFLPGEFFPDEIDRCAFLHLSVALRASEHYAACLTSKYKQLAIDFSAKVGQLTANLYGQVATQALDEQADIDPQQIKDEYKRRLLESESIYWISNEQERELRKRIQKAKAEGNGDINEENVKVLVSSLPSDKDMLVDRIIQIIDSHDFSVDKHLEILRNGLAGDTIIGRFLKR